jgi:hypothetical protein
VTPPDQAVVSQKVHANGLASELRALYEQRQFQGVVEGFESARQMNAATVSGDAAALQVTAQAYLRIGDFSTSAETFLSAAAIYVANQSPETSACVRNAFAALQRLGLHTAAAWLALRSFSLPRVCGADVEMLRYAVAIAIQRGDLNLATCIIAAASLYGATRAVALETLLDIAFRPTKYGAADARMLRPGVHVHLQDPKLSIIICSRDDARYARFVGECERALCSSHFEIIRIADAKSMCEGYNRATDAATGELLLYCHDDIEFITNGVHRALVDSLANFDVVSCVGSSVVDGPTWMCRDATNSQGWIAATDPHIGLYSVGIIGVPNRQSLLATGDGCFIACRRVVAQTLRWDEATFDSFHLYDIDFCLRARNNAFRVGVARDVTINHLSQGSFDAVWREHAQRFLQKHNILPGPEAINQWISIQVGSRAEAHRVAVNLMQFAQVDFQQTLTALQARGFEAACGEFPALAGFQLSAAEFET